MKKPSNWISMIALFFSLYGGAIAAVHYKLIPGPRGPRGFPGQIVVAGSTGPEGKQGNTGPMGEVGPRGFTGATGKTIKETEPVFVISGIAKSEEGKPAKARAVCPEGYKAISGAIPSMTGQLIRASREASGYAFVVETTIMAQAEATCKEY